MWHAEINECMKCQLLAFKKTNFNQIISLFFSHCSDFLCSSPPMKKYIFLGLGHTPVFLSCSPFRPIVKSYLFLIIKIMSQLTE